MAKQKRNTGGGPKPSQQPKSNVAKEAGGAINAANPNSKEMEAVDQIASEEGIKNDSSDESIKDPDSSNNPSVVVEAYRRHLAAEKVYQEATEKVSKREEGLKEREEALLAQEIEFARRDEVISEAEEDLATRKKNLDETELSINKKVADFGDRVKQLDDRERELSTKEQELLTGRLSESFEMYVKPLEEKRAEILNQISAHIGETQESVRAQWAKVISDLDSGNDEFRQDLMAKMKELDKHRTQLVADKSALDVEREEVDRERRQLEEERKNLAATSSEELAARRERLEVEYQSKRDALARRESDALAIVRKAEFITEWEDSLGDIESVAHEIERLKSTISNYESELKKRRTLNDESELLSLRLQLAELNEELSQLKSDYQAKVRESAAAASELLEAKAKFDEVENLISTIEQYKQQRDQLKKDMDFLSGVKEAESPFSECTSMDRDRNLQVAGQLVDESQFNLSQFVDQMQWLLYNPIPGNVGAKSLAYQKNDLRVFVAGLNMSRLHILEGVSGTGKTTLPIAFVRALGGGESNVAIQAGWRDRQDLLGYFNEFQQQFRETDFLRGMYRSMTPKFKNGLYFVVLDEMNLSKVEQYFADYLKGLEDAAGADVERGGSVPLMDRSGIAMPKNLQEGKNGGIELPLPPNVWFIGTANQDESTQSFAPKTQSRAHIMELPHKQPSREQMEREIGGKSYARFEPDSLGYQLLLQAFRAAEQKEPNKASTRKSKEIFDELREVIAKIDPGLALGPRFDRQLEAFVPVIMETGGSLSLAVDHLVSTKFVRRMKENYKITAKDRKLLSDSLEKVWRENSLGDFATTWSYTLLNRDGNA